MNKVLRPTRGDGQSVGRGELPWDRTIVLPDGEERLFFEAQALAVGAQPILTSFTHPVVPLEQWLDVGYGYCIQRCLLASIVLERLNVRHKVVMGALVLAGGSSSAGHTWIELPDGRVLDPSHELLEKKTEGFAATPGSFGLGNGFRFADASFPYLGLSR